MYVIADTVLVLSWLGVTYITQAPITFRHVNTHQLPVPTSKGKSGVQNTSSKQWSFEGPAEYSQRLTTLRKRRQRGTQPDPQVCLACEAIYVLPSVFHLTCARLLCLCVIN